MPSGSGGTVNIANSTSRRQLVMAASIALGVTMANTGALLWYLHGLNPYAPPTRVDAVVAAITPRLGPAFRFSTLGFWGACLVNWFYLTAVCYGIVPVIRWERRRRVQPAITA